MAAREAADHPCPAADPSPMDSKRQISCQVAVAQEAKNLEKFLDDMEATGPKRRKRTADPHWNSQRNLAATSFGAGVGFIFFFFKMCF